MLFLKIFVRILLLGLAVFFALLALLVLLPTTADYK